MHFDPLHAAQYTMFLYTLSKTIWKNIDVSEKTELCSKIYCLNKMFSSADLYYEVDLPEIYFFDHPQASVMGRAEYGEFFAFSQGCTVGNNKGHYPKFGEHVHMMSDSKILGDCRIGSRVIVSANSYIKDTDIPSDSIVFGMYPNLTIKPLSAQMFEELTKNIFRTKA